MLKKGAGRATLRYRRDFRAAARCRSLFQQTDRGRRVPRARSASKGVFRITGRSSGTGRFEQPRSSNRPSHVGRRRQADRTASGRRPRCARRMALGPAADVAGVYRAPLGRRLRRKIEPDDLLQEVSTDAIRSVAEIDFTKRDAFGWLCQIAERASSTPIAGSSAAKKRSAGRETGLDAGPTAKGVAWSICSSPA